MIPMATYNVLEAMALTGGSFARALADAFYRADPENFKRLRDAFPEIWTEYEEVARLRATAIKAQQVTP